MPDQELPGIPPVLSAPVAQALADSRATIAITGSGGWLGMATLEMLHRALGAALPDRVRCFGASARELVLTDGTRLPQRPLDDLAGLGGGADIVLHLAFLTKDRAADMPEADYVGANRALSTAVRDSLDRLGTRRLFVASSGAALLADDPGRSREMRLYGSLKRADEDMFSDWAERTGAKAVIGRIFNLSGPHMNKLGNYALASFIGDALAGRPIRVLAPHPVIRGYVSIRELMSLVFARLLADGTGTEWFATGGAPMELGEVAQQVAAALGGGAVERAPVTSQASDLYVGDDAEWRALLAGNGLAPAPFAEQVRETAEFLRSSPQGLALDSGVVSAIRA